MQARPAPAEDPRDDDAPRRDPVDDGAKASAGTSSGPSVAPARAPVRTGISTATIVVRALSIASILAAVSLSVWRSFRAPDTNHEPAAADTVDQREIAAKLDQVERDILDGHFERARRQLDAVTGALGGSPALRERARDSRLHLDVAEAFSDAFTAEQAGDRERALAKYREVTALKPQHAEALAAIERLTAAPALAEPAHEPVDSSRPTLRRRLAPAAGSAEPAPIEPAPIEPAVDPAANTASELLPTTRPADQAIFLPVGPT